MLKALNLIITAEKTLEASKQELALCQDYNIRDHFKLISGNADQIDLHAINSFFKDIGVEKTSKRELNSLIQMFDSDFDRKLGMEEFTRMVAPSQREYRILLNCRIDRYDETQNPTLQDVNPPHNSPLDILKAYKRDNRSTLLQDTEDRLLYQ